MKYESDLVPPEEPSTLRMAFAWVLILAFALFLTWCAASMAAEPCPQECEEARVTEAVSPSDTVWTFEGAGLNTFLQSMNTWGLMAGRPVNVDKVFVTRDNHERYTIFFITNACIVFAAHSPASVMERILPK